MRKFLFAFFSVFVFASCLITGSVFLTGCNNAGGGTLSEILIEKIVSNATDTMTARIENICFSSTNYQLASSGGQKAMAASYMNIKLHNSESGYSTWNSAGIALPGRGQSVSGGGAKDTYVNGVSYFYYTDTRFWVAAHRRALGVDIYRDSTNYEFFGFVRTTIESSNARDIVSSSPVYYIYNDGSKTCWTTSFSTASGNWVNDFNVSIYAVYREKFSATYNMNGGSGGPSSQTFYGGIGYTMSKIIPTKRGYVFKGWTRNSVGSGTYYQPGHVFADSWASSSDSWYANWEPKKYHLHFDANGGTITSNTAPYTCTHGMPEITYDSGSYWRMGDIDVERKGYTFNGWYTSTSGGTKVYNADDTCTNQYIFSNNVCNYDGTNNSIITLYAQWSVRQFNITVIRGDNGIADITNPATAWNYNGGNVVGGGKRVSVNFGASQTVSVSVKPGYSFAYWTGDSASTSASITCSVSQEKNYTFTAHTVPNKYILLLNPNGGEGVNLFSYIPQLGSSTNPLSSNGIDYYTSGKDIYISSKSNDSIDHYGHLDIWFYLNANVNHQLRFTAVSTNSSVLNSGVDAGFFLDGNYNTFYHKGGPIVNSTSVPVTYTYNFTPTISGRYQFRLDSNYNNAKFKLSNFSLIPNSGTSGRTVIYDSPYGTLPTPTRANYTFEAWKKPVSIASKTANAWVTLLEDNNFVKANLRPSTTYQVSYDLTLNEGIPSGYFATQKEQWGNLSFRKGESSSSYTYQKFGTLHNLSGDNPIAGKTYHITTSVVTPSDLSTVILLWYSARCEIDPNDGDVSDGYVLNGTISNVIFYNEDLAPTITHSTTYSTVGNEILLAKWSPITIRNHVYFRVISADGKTVSESNDVGSVNLQWYLPELDSQGNNIFREQEIFTSDAFNAHQGQSLRMTARAKSGYAFVGFSTSSTPSEAIKNPSSAPSTTATYYPTANTDYYVYFKQLSGNQLKYDETDKYFYFEDGYYPQSEANEKIIVYDKTKGYLNINGTPTEIAKSVKTIAYRFKEGEYYKLTFKLISGSVSNGGNLAICADLLDESKNTTIKTIWAATHNTYYTETYKLSATEAENTRFVKLRLYWNGGEINFSNCNYEVLIERDLDSELNEKATTEENITYNNGSSVISIPIYSYNNERYAKVSARGETKWFKFEPIRWRISDYGVAKTERNIARYTTLLKFKNYASFSGNFIAVSDLILGVGSMHNARSVKEGDSVQDLTGFQNVQNLTDNMSNDSLRLTYNKTGNIINVDQYSGYGSGQANAVNKDNTISYSSPFRITSLAELSEVGYINRGARASDMVAFILGQDKNQVSYWTRDLSNLGSGIAITATGTQIQPWLDEMLGMRFSYSFKEGSAGGGRIDYETLNYIESSGTQYINAGITVNSNFKVEANAAYTSTDGVQMLFGAQNANDSDRAFMLGKAASANTNCYAYYNFSYEAVKTMSGADWLNQRTYTLDRNKVIIDGEIVKTWESESWDTRTNLYLFGVSRTGVLSYATSAKLYGCKVWEDDVLVRDFVPVRNNYTGEIGLWDNVSGRFFGNSGTGSFLAG